MNFGKIALAGVLLSTPVAGATVISSLPVAQPFSPATATPTTDQEAGMGRTGVVGVGDTRLVALVTPVAPTPEPGSFVLLGTGLVGLALAIRGRSKRAATAAVVERRLPERVGMEAATVAPA